MVNEFSRQWFSTFMDTMPEVWTAAEVEAVARRLPLPAFRQVLDVCCGAGRHAAALAARGYRITGIDRDPEVLRRASSSAPTARFLQLDQRDLHTLEGPFDAVVILWQSFGYFDPATNDQVLSDIASLLRPEGRLLLDLFHPEHFVAEQGAPTPAARVDGVTITNLVREGRLHSTIEYSDGTREVMDFELFSPAALIERAALAGFEVLEQCCWCDEQRPPDPSVRRYQSVFRRR